MMILESIAARTRLRVERRKLEKPLEVVKREAEALGMVNAFAFERALGGKEISLICEVKKASPSKGVIDEAFPYMEIAREYERGGAAAISVLTEPEFFLGADAYLTEIKKQVEIPVLRKDFTVDAYQIYEAKCMGADAVLLICALLDTDTLRAYIAVADGLGLSCLVEAHSAAEVESALAAGSRVIGVNNRNLNDFTVDLSNSLRLCGFVPDDIIFVSESGIKTPEDVARLRERKVHAALIGETFMRSADKAAALSALYGGKRDTRVKICGLSRAEDISAVNRFKPDYIGFVFAPSRRRVTFEQAKALKAALDPSIRTVGVFVNAPTAQIEMLCREGVIDFVQLHGDETEADVRRLKAATGKPVIRAVRVRSREDVVAAEQSAADYLLFDKYTPDAYGGTGETFDWRLLERVRKPFFLAGGIRLRNAAAAIFQLGPHCLDISSGVETDGAKDENKIEEMINLVRSVAR